MLKRLFLIAVMGVSVYFYFIHRSRELPLSVVNEGIAVVDQIYDVKLSGYKCYNPGVIEYGDGYLLVTREKAESFFDYVKLKLLKKRNNVIKLAELDNQFCAKGDSVQIIPRENDSMFKVTDPRLFSHQGKIYMIFCDHSKGGSIQTLSELEKIDGKWQAKNVKHLEFDGSEFVKANLVQKGIEKNWMPFSQDGKIFIVYLLEPEKVVLEVDIESGRCSVASRTKNELIDKFAPLRGGTAPIFDKELGEFITVYHVAYPGRHSYTNLKKNVYIGGAYTFSKEAPFVMTKKTKGPFYQKELYSGREKIIFPTALIQKDDHYLMFYGEDDCKIKVAKINKKKLLSEMKEVACK